MDNNQKAVASKLHGVDVDIKIIKRKGDPLNPQPPTVAVRKDDVSQQNSGSATDISTNNNNLSRCPNEFTSPNNLNGLPNSQNGNASK